MKQFIISAGFSATIVTCLHVAGFNLPESFVPIVLFTVLMIIAIAVIGFIFLLLFFGLGWVTLRLLLWTAGNLKQIERAKDE